jgi:selenocysteine lyase/cysteine desulfurase
LKDLPVDFIAGAGHKWMCSLVGQGFFAGTPEFLSKLSPVVIGAGTFGCWGTVGNPGQKMDATARRFEPGGLAFAPLFALDSAIGLLQATGGTAIEAEIRRLSARLRGGLRELGIPLATPVEQRGGITSVRLDARVEAVFFERCRHEKIAISKRGVYTRFSLHAFCRDEEIDRVLGILKESSG